MLGWIKGLISKMRGDSVLYGARRVGKSTLAQQLWEQGLKDARESGVSPYHTYIVPFRAKRPARDHAGRIAAAQAKRERRNRKRLRDSRQEVRT